MRSTYVYLKKRTSYGKQCIFNVQEAHREVILPNPSLNDNYILRNSCHKNVQVSKQPALHEAQTIKKTFKNSGMFHFEGGWPKEINPRDEEATMRFRRRVEKEDDWAPNLRVLFNRVENCLLQNSAINVYDHYFDDMMSPKVIIPPHLRTLNVYANSEMIPRPVTNISWSPDSKAKIAVTHFREFSGIEDNSFVSYIWDIESSKEPSTTLNLCNPAVVTEFNPRDPFILASGLMSGQVCSWDLRIGNVPSQESQIQISHRYPVSCLKWTDSTDNLEFFTGSSDGQIMWWDMRNLSEPTQVLIADLNITENPEIENATGVTSINYESSMPDKFLFGTQSGIIISGSRDSTTHAEKLASRFRGHLGSICSVDRNPFNPKYILSTGDWSYRIWNEDHSGGNLISSPFSEELLTGGCWSRLRYSNLYVINMQGELAVWDLLVGLSNPVATIQLSKEKLTAIAPHEDGTLLTIGDHSGNVYLVEASEALTTFEKNDRINLTMYFDRCLQQLQLMDDHDQETNITRVDDQLNGENVEANKNTDITENQMKADEAEIDSKFEEAEAQYLKCIKASESETALEV